MKAVLDACVLFPTILRELLEGAAAAGLYEPLVSERILGEWVRATDRLGPGARATADAEAVAFRHRFPQALVPPAPDLELRLSLPDPADVHVLASAISAGAAAIVTFNAADFPQRALAPHGITRRDPDEFLWELHSAAPDLVAAIAESVHSKAETLSGRQQSLGDLLRRGRLFRLARALQAS
jgi:predicted nucleic acid-binding protein